MTIEHKPITEAELAKIEALDALRDTSGRITLSNADAAQVQNVKVIIQLADAVPDLVAEVRRLRTLMETADRELFSANVEIDNLRKMLADARQREERLISLLDELRRVYHVEDLPVPMCRPDALEDLFPPASGEGRPT